MHTNLHALTHTHIILYIHTHSPALYILVVINKHTNGINYYYFTIISISSLSLILEIKILLY